MPNVPKSSSVPGSPSNKNPFKLPRTKKPSKSQGAPSPSSSASTSTAASPASSRPASPIVSSSPKLAHSSGKGKEKATTPSRPASPWPPIVSSSPKPAPAKPASSAPASSPKHDKGKAPVRSWPINPLAQPFVPWTPPNIIRPTDRGKPLSEHKPFDASTYRVPEWTPAQERRERASQKRAREIKARKR